MAKGSVRVAICLWLAAGALAAPISCGSKSDGKAGGSGDSAGDAAGGPDLGASAGGALDSGGSLAAAGSGNANADSCAFRPAATRRTAAAAA